MSKVSPASSKAAARSSKSATAGAKSGANAKGKLPVPLLLGGGIFLVVIFVFLYMLFGGSDEKAEQDVEVVIPQSSELDTGARSAPTLPVNEVEDEVLIEEDVAVVVEDPFESPDPINAITESAVTTAITSDPSYTENVGFLMPDGTMFSANTPEFAALKQEVGGPVHAKVNGMIVTQPSDNGDVWMFNDVDSGKGPIPLATQEAKGTVMATAVQSSNQSLQDVKARYTPQQAAQNDPSQQTDPQQAQQPVQQVVEVSSINDEERQLLNSIVQELRTQNKNTKADLQLANEAKLNAQKELVQLRQRVEDNPALKNIVRATMLPKSTGYKLDAVMGNKIFLRNIKTDDITILQPGQNIPTTTFSIASADMDTGIVLVTPSK